MAEQHIVSGSAGFQETSDGLLRVGPIIRYLLELSGKDNPKFCYVATASEDNPQVLNSVYSACTQETIEVSHLGLFPEPNHTNSEKFILDQDVVWVGGGAVATLIETWKKYGLFNSFRKAWEEGVILGGISAGSICWSAGGTTDSFGPKLRPIINEHGLLPYSSGVHYNSEEQRRPLFHQLISDKIIPEGYATDDGVALHFVGTALSKAIADTPDKFAYHVYADNAGRVVEERIEPELLPC